MASSSVRLIRDGMTPPEGAGGYTAAPFVFVGTVIRSAQPEETPHARDERGRWLDRRHVLVRRVREDGLELLSSSRDGIRQGVQHAC